MASIDDQIAALFDEVGVPRAEEKPQPQVKAKPKDKKKEKLMSDREIKQMLNDFGSLRKRFARNKEKLEAQAKRIRALEAEKAAYDKKMASVPSTTIEHEKVSGKKHQVTVKHPDCNLIVRLSNNRILIVFDEQFFVTSIPLDQSEDHNVVLNGKCVDFLSTLEEFDWINEQISEMARAWRVEAKAPLVLDYVFDKALVKALKDEGITTLYDAYMRSRMGVKGVGPKRTKILEEAYKTYQSDEEKQRREGKSIVFK